ncbi:MAG: hypothetical protein AB8B51_02200 [Sedimentitalea sp.]
MSRLVIHVGDCKSGSTAIQSVLQAGSYQSETPILYPDAGRRGALNHHRLSNALFMAQAKQWQARAWGALAKEVTDSDQLAVISSERFEFAEPNVLRDVLRQHFDPLPDLHIIAYVRPHLERCVSGYAQNVKQGIFESSMSAFIDKMASERRFHYAPRLARWRSVFEDMRVDIRPMIRDQLTGGCVVQDFLTLITGAPATVNEIPMANSAPSAPALDLLRQLWQAAGPERDGKTSPNAAALTQFGRSLETSDPFGGEKLRLTGPEATIAQTHFAEDARACDVQIFGRPVLGPALAATVGAAPNTAEPTTANPEAVAVATLWMQTTAQMLQARATKPKGRSPNTAQWRGVQK